MVWRLSELLSQWTSNLKSRKTSQADAPRPSHDTERLSSVPSQPGLPPPPRELITNRVLYEIPLLQRRGDYDTDTPKACLYRTYEHLVPDQHTQLRNQIEAFWWHPDWPVKDIPDPRDEDDHAERLACLACIPKLLCLAFNKRIEMGLPRDAPPIFSRDMLDEWRKQERALEQEPKWVEEIPPFENVLAIPHWDNDKRDFVALESFDDIRVSPQCADKNILIWKTHVHFA